MSLKYKEAKGLAGFVSKVNLSVKARMALRRVDSALPTSSDTSSTQAQVQVEQDLEPLLACLNAHLERLAEHVSDEALHVVVRDMWAHVVSVVESLLVHGLGDRVKEKTPWERKRLDFARETLEVR